MGWIVYALSCILCKCAGQWGNSWKFAKSGEQGCAGVNKMGPLFLYVCLFGENI